MASTTACAPNSWLSSLISSGLRTAAVLTETLSAPASRMRRASLTERMPPPTASGMKTLRAVRATTSTIVSRASLDAVISRKTNSSAPSRLYRSANSTGSPASRRLTKWTPLTTRPLVTSRHGMMRLANTRRNSSQSADTRDSDQHRDRQPCDRQPRDKQRRDNQSRDRKGAESLNHATPFPKPRAQLTLHEIPHNRQTGRARFFRVELHPVDIA